MQTETTQGLTIPIFPINISVTDISSTDIKEKGGSVIIGKKQRETQDFLPLTPAVFYVLLALSDGERHGYGIMQEVARRTDGQVHMGPGTLYGSIKRMITDGLIEESGTRPDPELDDERRRYYRLTAQGNLVVRAEARRLQQLVYVAHMKQLLPEEG